MTLQMWLDQWKHKSPQVQGRVRIALDFMRKHYKGDDATILSEIRCIDFSLPVNLPVLPARTMLVGVKDPRSSPDRARYFTRSGHPASRLGIATSATPNKTSEVLNKVLFRYEVMFAIPSGEVLETTCAPAADIWSIEGKKVLAAGGGIQFFIPNMNRYLRFMP